MSQPFVPGYGPSIPAPTPGVDVEDEGVPLGSFQTINFTGAGVASAPGAPGVVDVAIPGGGGPANTVQDVFGNVVPGVVLFSVQAPSSVAAGAPGEALIYPFNTPTDPGDDLRAVFAESGDLNYSPALKFETASRIPTFTGVGNYPRFDNSLGYTVFRFNPDDAPAGAPWFGTGNGFLWKAQNAAPGSGLAGGDVGYQAGNGRDAGGTGGTAFLQAGGNPDSPSDRGVSELRDSAGNAIVRVGGPNGQALSFFGGVPDTQPTVVGSNGGIPALVSFLSELANLNLLVDASVATPLTPGEALTWSPVDYWLAKASALLSQDAGNYTSGNVFDVIRPVSISGARFYWHGGARTLRVRLWDNAGASLASVDVVVPGPGVYTATFAAPVAIATTGPSNSKYTISYYDLSGAAQYTRIAANAYAIAPGSASWPTVNWIARSVVMGFYRGYYNPATGDSFPNSEIGNTYLIEPTIVN